MRNFLRRQPCGVLPRRDFRRSAFTLIELLTVIAIIGILAAIVIPTVGTVREKAEKAVDSNKLREILKAAQIYAGDNRDQLPNPQPAFIPNTVLNAPQPAWKWPGILAKNNILTDPAFYFCKNDPAFNGTVPPFIINPSAARNTLHPQFINQRSPSWSFVGGVKMSDAATTPVIFTRGLIANTGLWSATSGVYRSTGGFIAFLGGNIAFYPNVQTASGNSPFYSNNPASTSQTRPQNILQAIPFNPTTPATSARIYSINPPSGGGGMVGTPAGQLAARGP
jgi:prepilin-type N-terminal cleavage/methylation domain-containing protein